MTIILDNIPKVSLNQFFGRSHWSERKKSNDKFHWIVRSANYKPLSKLKSYSVVYNFEFRIRPLDASNCVAMVKMIEDALFEDDNHKVIPQITIKSVKSDKDRVTINIKEI